LCATVIRNNAATLERIYSACVTPVTRRELVRCVRLSELRFEGDPDDVSIARACIGLTKVTINYSTQKHASSVLQTLAETLGDRLRALTMQEGDRYEPDTFMFEYRTSPQVTEHIELLLSGLTRVRLDTRCLRLLTRAIGPLARLAHVHLEAYDLLFLERLLATYPHITHFRVDSLTCRDALAVRSDVSRAPLPAGGSWALLSFRIVDFEPLGGGEADAENKRLLERVLRNCSQLERFSLDCRSLPNPLAETVMQMLATWCPRLKKCTLINCAAHDTVRLPAVNPSSRETRVVVFPKLEKLSLRDHVSHACVRHWRMPALVTLTICDTHASWDLADVLRHSPLLETLWLSFHSVRIFTCSPIEKDAVLCSRLATLRLYSATHSADLEVVHSMRSLLNGLLSWCSAVRDVHLQRDNMRFADLEELTALPAARHLARLECDLDQDCEPVDDPADQKACAEFDNRVAAPLVRTIEQCPKLTYIKIPGHTHMDVRDNLLYPILRLRPNLELFFFGSRVMPPEHFPPLPLPLPPQSSLLAH
jgi:hypothetical protein